jgi:hypothetical protein
MSLMSLLHVLDEVPRIPVNLRVGVHGVSCSAIWYEHAYQPVLPVRFRVRPCVASHTSNVLLPVRFRIRPFIASYASNVVLPTRLQWDSHETGGKDDRYDLEIVHQHGQLKTVSCKSSMVEVNWCDLGPYHSCLR